MSSNAPALPPHKKRHTWRWPFLAALLFSIALCGHLFAQEVPLKVSRETTYITQPLDPDGLPDYEQYVWNQQKQGVTPESNAAVLLWQAMWPGDLDPPQYAPMAKALGLKEIPTGKASLPSDYDKAIHEAIISWLKAGNISRSEGIGISEDAYDELADLFEDHAMSCPWTSQEIPPLANLIKENQPAIDLAVEASQRPRYFSPSPSFLDNERTTLIAVLLPDLQGDRIVGRWLLMRAMQHAGEGRPEKAWDDLLAIYRLARLVKQGPTLIDQLFAIALNNLAFRGTVALLNSHDVNKELARQIQKDLADLDTFSSMIDRMDHMERLQALDAVLQMRLHGPSCLSEEPKESSPKELARFRAAIDWNIVLEDVNQWFDRLIQAARTPGRAARDRAIAQVEDDLKNAGKDGSRIVSIIGAAFSIRTRSHSISSIVAGLMLPATGAALEAEDRGNTELALIRLAAALAVYRVEHGEYPKSLDALVPDTLAELPVDLYYQKPFFYHRDGNGYLLYSAGPNGLDDGGSNVSRSMSKGRLVSDYEASERERLEQQIPAGADDIPILLSTPLLKLPELKSVVEPAAD
jgi:hypothetical protein